MRLIFAYTPCMTLLPARHASALALGRSLLCNPPVLMLLRSHEWSLFDATDAYPNVQADYLAGVRAAQDELDYITDLDGYAKDLRQANLI